MSRAKVTSEVMLQRPLVGALKGVEKACTETVKYLPIGACDHRFVDVGPEEDMSAKEKSQRRY